MVHEYWIGVLMTTHDDLDEAFADLPPILTVAQIAKLLQMTPPGVYKWLREGHLHGYQVGRTWFVTKVSLRATLEAGSSATNPTMDHPEVEG